MTVSIKVLLKNPFIQGILFALFLWILWEIRFILVILFIAYIIASALYPIASFLQERHFPKWLAITLPYLALIVIIVVLIVPIVPFVASQSSQLIAHFPRDVEKAGKIVGIHVSLTDIKNFLRSRIETIGTSALSFTFQTVAFLFASFVTIFLSIYFLIDRQKIYNAVASFPPRHETLQLLQQAEAQIGGWARGQLILSFVIAIANFLAYVIIGIPYALPLAVLAGLLEIVPTIGPIIASIPAIIVGLTISFPKALLVSTAFLLIQMLEGNFLVPRIMARVVGLHPIIVILAILIGGEFLGILGALISIPFASLLMVMWQEIGNRKK